jgi:N-acetylglutamate synthase-like GNAT family acetyltransferase
MRIVDLTPEHERAYLHCLEPEEADIADGVERKRAWLAAARDKGLLVKLALDDDGEVAGMVQAMPIEHTHVLGEKLHFIHCIWVHSHDNGIGDRSGRGMGAALLEAVEQEARAAGSLGMAAWGLALPMWMRASWFKKHGFRAVDRDGIAKLLFKPFRDDARAPRWMAPGRAPWKEDGHVTVTCFNGGWCTLQNANCVRARRAAETHSGGVVFREIDTSDPEVARRVRQDYAVFVDDKQIGTGPPLREEKVLRVIEKKRGRNWWSRRSS